MNFGGIELLSARHVTSGFDCGKPALNAWLARRAPPNQESGTTRTWVTTEQGTPNVAAFYASCTAAVLRSSTPGRLGHGQPEQVPALLLARMGVAEKHQNRGLGAALLKHFVGKARQVSTMVGIRLLLVHAKDEDARSFYEHYGFVQSPVGQLTLMMLLADEQ